MGANDPLGGAIFDPRGMVGGIYKEDHYTLLQRQYESSGINTPWHLPSASTSRKHAHVIYRFFLSCKNVIFQ